MPVLRVKVHFVSFDRLAWSTVGRVSVSAAPRMGPEFTLWRYQSDARSGLSQCRFMNAVANEHSAATAADAVRIVVPPLATTMLE